MAPEWGRKAEAGQVAQSRLELIKQSKSLRALVEGEPNPF